MNVKKSILSSCKKSIRPRKSWFGEKSTYAILFIVHMFDGKMTIDALARGAIELNPIFAKTYSLGWDIFLISKVLMTVFFIFFLAKFITYRKHNLWRFGVFCGIISGLLGGLSGVYSCYF